MLGGSGHLRQYAHMATTAPDGPAATRWLLTSALTDPTRCPSCASSLAGRTCPACSLDVSGPRGHELWELSEQAATVLERRAEVIAEMRVASRTPAAARSRYAPPASEHGRSPRPAATHSADAGRAVLHPGDPIRRAESAVARAGVSIPGAGGLVPPAPGPVPGGAVFGPPAPLPWQAARSAQPQPHPHPGTARSGWALQTILQVVGALLLAGAGLVFTVFAWGSLPLGARGVILAGITAAVFAGARRAARANLPSSAQVIAALGSILVVLDAWVLLSTTIAGAGSAAVSMAGALLVGAAVLIPLGRALALPTASVAGLVGLTLAPAVLATASSWVPGAALLLTASTALCLLGLRPIASRRASAADAPAQSPTTGTTTGATAGAGTGTVHHTPTVFTVLAWCYLALAAFVMPAALVDAGAAQSVVPLVAMFLACGLWAVCSGAGSDRPWSATAGVALALAGSAGAASLIGTASPLAFMWLVPAGAVVGVAATIGVLRVLPRVGVLAARAGWVVVLVTGLAPASATALWLATTMLVPSSVDSTETSRTLLPILAGLAVIVAATPALHRMGGDLIRTPGPAESAAGSVVLVPRPRRVLLDHPLGVSLIASTVLLLGLPLMVPDIAGAVIVQLILAVLVALASTRLPARAPALAAGPGRPVGSGAAAGPGLTSGPCPPFTPEPTVERTVSEKFASVLRGCVQLFCAAAAIWASITSIVLASGESSVVSARTGHALVAASFVVAGLVLWVARGWSLTGGTHRTGNRAALALASLVITSVGVGILARDLSQLTSVGWYAAPFPLLLVLLVLSVRDLRAARTAHGASAATSDRLAALGAAAVLVAPGCVVTAATAVAGDPGASVTVTVLATVVAAMSTVLCWLLSWGAGATVQAWLRAVAGTLAPALGVLTLLSLRPVAVSEDLALARLDWPLAVLVLLVVMITWAGATAPGVSRLACERTVVALGVATTVVVIAEGGAARVTLALSISSLGALAYAVAARRPRWGWLALGLGVWASWVSLDSTALPVEAYTAPGGAVVVAVGVWQLLRSLKATVATAAPAPTAAAAVTTVTDRTDHAVRVLLAGLIVLIAPTVLLTPGAGTPGRAAITLVAMLWLGGTAWLLTATSATVAARLRPLAVGMTVLALVAAPVGLGGYSVALARTVSSSSETGLASGGSASVVALWTAAAVLVTAALAFHLAQLRFPRSATTDRRLATLAADPRVWAVTVCVGLLSAPATVLLAEGWFADGSVWAAGVLVTVWGVAALLGTPPGVPRVRSTDEFTLRAVPALTGAYVMALVGAAASSGEGVGAGGDAFVGLLTTAGLFVAVVSVRAAQTAPASSTWSTVAFGALATIVPLTLHMIAEPSGAWIAAATTTSAAWLVLGVRLRWQAPLACGAVALVVQVATLAGPPALAAMSGMLGWIVLAAVGGTLLALGLTYERQISTAREVLRRYSELR